MNFRRISLLMAVLLMVPALLFFSCSSQEFASAKLYLQQGNLEEAEEQLKQAEDAEPDNPQIPYLLGAQIYAPEGEYELMNEAFERSLAIGDDYAGDIEQVRLTYWSQEFNSGAKLFNQALEQQGEERQELMRQAVNDFETAVQVMPSKPETYGTLATAYLILEDYDRAEETFETALQQQPENYTLLFNYGRMQSERGITEQAIDLLERAHEVAPDSSTQSTQLLANLYIQEDRMAEASDMMDEAIAENPEVANLHFNKAMILINMAQSIEEDDSEQAQEYYEEATASMENAIEINPDDAEALERAGELYQELERWEQAVGAFEQALELNPNDAQLMRKLAISVYRTGDNERAQELLNQVKEMQGQAQ